MLVEIDCQRGETQSCLKLNVLFEHIVGEITVYSQYPNIDILTPL